MWSLMKRLIWLHVISGGGGGGTVTTVTGTSPLTLANALAKSIRSLIQYGKVTTSNGDTYCNNGKLVAVDDELPSGYTRITGIKFDGDFYYDTGEVLNGDDVVTMTLANTATTGQNVFGSYNGTSAGTKNFSLFIYGGGSNSNSYFRYGEQLLRPKFGSNEHTITLGGNGTTGFATDVTATPETFTTTATAYIGMLPNSSSAAYSGSIMGSILVGTRLKWIPCERVNDGVIGYYEAVNGTFLEPAGTGTPVAGSYDTSHLNALSVEGTPEVLTVGEQTASVENLLAVDDIKDEHNIISGAVTRRCEAVISDGTTPSGRYIGEVGEGNIIVKVRETGYEGDVVTFDADKVAPLNGLTVNVEPIQAGSGDPSPDNVRPISGRTSATIYHSGEDTSDPTTYTIQLGDTVYGGTLDVTGGKMVVDRAIVDLGTLNWTKFSVSHGSLFRSSEVANSANVYNSTNFICSNYATAKSSKRANGTISSGVAKQFDITDNAYSDVATFKSAMSGVQLCYELATPIEIILTPTQIDTLLGTNNIWSDAGSVKAYVADGDVIEHVTAQPMRTAEGSNTVSVTSAVAPVQLSATYTAPD